MVDLLKIYFINIIFQNIWNLFFTFNNATLKEFLKY